LLGLIEHMLHHQVPREIVLYWGARTKRDLYLPDLPGRWQTENPNFTFIPVLSEPAADDAWPGRTGFVHQAVLDAFPELSGYPVYACGAPPMIDAARRDFTTLRALLAAEFYADSFTYAAETEQAAR
jgi:CDP-4-dehydro-6-deoxyglucose reductase